MSAAEAPGHSRVGLAAPSAGAGQTIEGHLRTLAPRVLSELEAVLARHDTLQVGTKRGAYDLVTDADRSIEAWLFEETSRAFPKDGFLGEEAGRRLGSAAGTDWIVDPIDGTVNFVNGLPWACCSIGVTVCGVPAGGLIVDPFRREIYLTAPTLTRSELDGMPIAVRPGAEIAGRLVLLEVPSGTGLSQLRSVEEHVRVGEGATRTMGSGALALAAVAAGRAQAVVHLSPSVWDVAAGVALVVGAGGVVLGREGLYVLGEPGPLVAGNRQVCERLQPLLETWDGSDSPDEAPWREP